MGASRPPFVGAQGIVATAHVDAGVMRAFVDGRVTGAYDDGMLVQASLPGAGGAVTANILLEDGTYDTLTVGAGAEELATAVARQGGPLATARGRTLIDFAAWALERLPDDEFVSPGDSRRLLPLAPGSRAQGNRRDRD